MARTDTLNHYLTDIADSIRTKTGESGEINANSFDTTIGTIPSPDPTEYFNGDFANDPIYSSPTDWVKYRFIKKAPIEIDCTGKTSLQSMFHSSVGFVESVPILKNTSSVKDFKSLFGSQQVTSINVSKIDTSAGTNFQNMFSMCNKLTSLDASNWVTNGTNIQCNAMFQYCYALQSIDLRNFGDTTFNGATNMFSRCDALMHLDIRSMNLTSLSQDSFNNMFNRVPTNCEIIVKDGTQKAWMNTNFSSYTNVKTVAEYENE